MTKPKGKKLTNEQVLKKCIEIAVGNGWITILVELDCEYDEASSAILTWDRDAEKGTPNKGVFGLLDIVFSHPFAKALFSKDNVYCLHCLFEIAKGEKWPKLKNAEIAKNDTCCGNQYFCGGFGDSGGHVPVIEDWQYHLQQMVLEENPIDYLREWLRKEWLVE